MQFLVIGGLGWLAAAAVVVHYVGACARATEASLGTTLLDVDRPATNAAGPVVPGIPHAA